MKVILLIDDDDLVALTIEHMLTSADYQVIRAAEGEAGLQLLKTHPVDLVLTDIIMPGKEGIETIREFRQLDPGWPIIAMSGGGLTLGADYLRMAQALGANAVLAKPFDQEDLLAIIESCLKI